MPLPNVTLPTPAEIAASRNALAQAFRTLYPNLSPQALQAQMDAYLASVAQANADYAVLAQSAAQDVEIAQWIAEGFTVTRNAAGGLTVVGPSGAVLPPLPGTVPYPPAVPIGPIQPLPVVDAATAEADFLAASARGGAAAADGASVTSTILRGASVPLIVLTVGNEIRLTAQAGTIVYTTNNLVTTLMNQLDTVNTYRLDSAASCAAVKQQLDNIEQQIRENRRRYREAISPYSSDPDASADRMFGPAWNRLDSVRARVNRICAPILQQAQVNSSGDPCKDAFVAAVRAALNTAKEARAATWNDPAIGRAITGVNGERLDQTENYLQNMLNQLQAGTTTTTIARQDISRIVATVGDNPWLPTAPVNPPGAPAATGVLSGAIHDAFRSLLSAMQACPPPILPPVQTPTAPVIMS